MKLLLLASLGGALGAGSRYMVGHFMSLKGWTAFPFATLTVNVVGCFLMGLLIALMALRFGGSPEARTFLATGILGGFTTFSDFAIDFATLFERGEQGLAFVYVAASVLLSLLAVFAGLWVTRITLS